MPKKTLPFPLVMKSTAFLSALLTGILALLYRFFPRAWILSVAISAGTTFYHFAMRLLVGSIVPHFLTNPQQNRWFQEKRFEPKLYAALKVKMWKDHMPTYNPAFFSLKENSLDQIVHNCCISEAVHEVIILCSFVPLLFALRWGSLPVFLITSLLAAAYDCSFAVMQRYNRPRLVRILEKRRHQSL